MSMCVCVYIHARVLAHNQVNIPTEIYQKKIIKGRGQHTCTKMSIIVLFILVKIQNSLTIQK